MQDAPTVEHVVLFHMTTYEWIYVGLILIQTIFLIKYAWETVKLRRTADAQLEVIKAQTETMRNQNQTLSKQLAASLDEIERNRKYEISRNSPLFSVATSSTTGDKREIKIDDIKARIRWDEIRANVPWRDVSMGTALICGRVIEVPKHLEVVYIGIKYSRLEDNEQMTVVLSFEPNTRKYKEETSMDFYQLPLQI